MLSKYARFFCIILTLSLAVLPVTTHAAFNPHVIISDFEFADYTSMTLDDIQRFLVEKGSSLATYVDQTIRVRASQLIHDNSQLAQINPKVLLAKLQKEQSLITHPSPSKDQLDWATGYGICDSCSKSAPEVQKYRGFANQIDYAASSLRLFYNNPHTYGYAVGKTYTIDGEAITIGNRATHALYLYTPHIQGNKNFNTIYTDWFAKEFPDGTLLQDATSGGIYLIQNGTKRPFGSRVAFATRYDYDRVITTSTENLNSYPLGPPIKYAQYSLIRSPKGTVYLIVDDKKRGFTSREVLRNIGINPEEIVDLEQTELDTIPEGKPITLADAHPMGVLLQDTIIGGVWYVHDNIRHAIWAKELMDINYSHLKPIPTHPDDIAKFTLGEPTKLNDGELIKSADSPAVYVISNTLKRPIPSEEVFTKLGYKWTNIRVVPHLILSLHETGEPLNAD